MKNSIRITGLTVIILSGIALFLSTCKRESDIFKISKAKLSGYVQKGPFVNGTSIQMYELNSSLDQTGNVFNTLINNNKGSFEISNVNLLSQYVQFSANGYYYDEILGEVSNSPLNLIALADIFDISTVNVNILTHLEQARVEYLMDNGGSFAEAKDTAQREVLAIFGYELDDMDPSEMLDISVDKEGNAILIAISLILQGNRSVGDLTELLANINTDIREDGQLNDTNIITGLINSASELNLSTIRSNLQNRYDELGLSVTIPDFEQYIYDFISTKGSKPTISDFAVKIGVVGAELSGTVNANGLSTRVSFEYGLTTDNYQIIDAEQNPVTGNLNTPVSAHLDNGLDRETQYHFRIRAENALGTSYSGDLTFTTWGAPSVVTGNHMYPGSESALLTGEVNPHGLWMEVSFEYGTTAAYGNETKPVFFDYYSSSFENEIMNFRLSGLSPETEYHYRIKAFDHSGIFDPPILLGEDKSFTTLNTITAADGNIYNIVEIGSQIWMAENLKTTKYNNGDSIETTIPDTLDHTDQPMCKYQWAYDGDENNAAIYGRLYTWYVIEDSRGVCPSGWHIPSDEEWIALANYLGGDTIAGAKLKEAGEMHWNYYNAATNESGFTAIPGGYRLSSKFGRIGHSAIWWSSSEFSSTQAGYWKIIHWESLLQGQVVADKRIGLSVRCIKDN